MDVSGYLKAIDTADAVAFDIFDTLLVCSEIIITNSLLHLVYLNNKVSYAIADNSRYHIHLILDFGKEILFTSHMNKGFV